MGIDTVNEQTGQDVTKEISMTGEPEVISDSGIETVEGFEMKDVAELEKFMNDPIEVFVYEPFESGHEHVVQLGVNGVTQYVIRGMPQTIKRRYVEVLARSKKQGVSAMGYKDNMGEAKNVVNITTGLMYPFQILKDPNTKYGGPWLRKILAEG